MADEITNEQIAELRRLHEAATPPERFSVTRYGHGGGRVCAEPRDLVADFYSEADRECWIAARNALPALLSRLATLEAALRECEDYFDQRADADCAGDPAAYAGNREMTLLGIVRRALRGLEGK